MSINLQELFSVNASGIKKSVIRELLKLTSNPEIISFAGIILIPPHTQNITGK